MGFGRTVNNNEILPKWYFNYYFFKRERGMICQSIVDSVGTSVNLSDYVYSNFYKNVQTDMKLKCYWSRI